MIDFRLKEARFVVANKALVDALLEMNTHNRRAKTTAVSTYKKDIENGTFVATNQGIGVSKSGVLIDGQNRLLAMRAANYPAVEFLLVTGLDDDAQKHIDQHARRSQADILRLALNQSASSLAVSALNTRQTFVSKQSADRLTIDQLAEQMAEHHDLLAKIIGELRGVRKSAIVAALLDYALLGTESNAISLARQIGTGELLDRQDPAYKIREIATRAMSGGHDAVMRIYRLMISACVADWCGKKLGVLKETEKWPRFIFKSRERYMALVDNEVRVLDAPSARL